MDEMRVKLGTKWLRGIAAKLISREIYKKTGCKVNIQLNELDAWVLDGDTTVKVNAELKLNSNEFKKILNVLEEEL